MTHPPPQPWWHAHRRCCCRARPSPLRGPEVPNGRLALHRKRAPARAERSRSLAPTVGERNRVSCVERVACAGPDHFGCVERDQRPRLERVISIASARSAASARRNSLMTFVCRTASGRARSRPATAVRNAFAASDRPSRSARAAHRSHCSRRRMAVVAHAASSLFASPGADGSSSSLTIRSNAPPHAFGRASVCSEDNESGAEAPSSRWGLGPRKNGSGLPERAASKGRPSVVRGGSQRGQGVLLGAGVAALGTGGSATPVPQVVVGQ